MEDGRPEWLSSGRVQYELRRLAPARRILFSFNSKQKKEPTRTQLLVPSCAARNNKWFDILFKLNDKNTFAYINYLVLSSIFKNSR